MQILTILGSTGSIGRSTLQVVALHPDKYQIFALTGHDNVELMWQQCQQFIPDVVVMTGVGAAMKLQQKLRPAGIKTEVLATAQDLISVAEQSQVTTVMAAIVGAAGLAPALAAAKSGKRLLLANKEALVVGGQLFMQAVVDGGATLLPIDSEHSAIFQSLPDNRKLWASTVDKIILTASGGPFHQLPLAEFANITQEQACSHPNFSMGRKISVDSATMVNKALEVVEAKYLFSVDAKQIEVVIHPQQVIHSMVQYKDSSVIAQLGASDMRIPIAYGLAWPQRVASGAVTLDFTKISAMSFEKPEVKRYPAFQLIWQVLAATEGSTIVYNAANEIAVTQFLAGKLNFLQIERTIKQVLDKIRFNTPRSFEEIMQLDLHARKISEQILAC